MIAGQYDHKWLAWQFDDFDVLGGGRVFVFAHVTDDEVEFATKQRRQQIARTAGDDTHLDAVMLRREGLNRTGQKRLRGIGSGADSDMPRCAAACVRSVPITRP